MEDSTPYTYTEAELQQRISTHNSEWAELACAMLSELRVDYAPGELLDGDGPKAIRRLQQRIAEAVTAEREAIACFLERTCTHRDEADHQLCLRCSIAWEIRESVPGFCRGQ